jgi:moderate conductance mechanosensitive channel
VRLEHVVSMLVVAGVELAFVFIVTTVFYRLATGALDHTASRFPSLADSSRALRKRSRGVVIITACLLALVIVTYNGWLARRGIDARAHTVALLQATGYDVWRRIGSALAKLAAAALGFLIAVRVVRRLLGRFEAALSRWGRLKDPDKRVRTTFAGLSYAIVNAGWLLLAVFALQVFGVPEGIVSVFVIAVRVYLVIAIGVLLIRASVVIVDTLDGLGQRYVETRDWKRYYEHLRPLVPTFRACLEYGLWVAVASLAIFQLAPVQSVVDWGPRLIEAIGLFFLGRVVIELGRLEIDHRMLPKMGLDVMSRRRRETMAPIVRSAFTYAVYFGTAVMILANLGFNPMPFLAGAGILGIVIGFGAQALIHDVVSGFFILFENTYLIGDAIEAGGAKGVVEAIEFRTTKIRDAEGRLHVLRNGEVKQVVNYSKGYTVAVVSLDVPYEVDLPQVFTIVREAGERVRRENQDVIGEIQIDGISAFGTATMALRTSTRVKAGRHEATSAALRLAIKEAFDRWSAVFPRKTLVPDKLVSVAPHAPDNFRRRR